MNNSSLRSHYKNQKSQSHGNGGQFARQNGSQNQQMYGNAQSVQQNSSQNQQMQSQQQQRRSQIRDNYADAPASKVTTPQPASNATDSTNRTLNRLGIRDIQSAWIASEILSEPRCKRKLRHRKSL